MPGFNEDGEFVGDMCPGCGDEINEWGYCSCEDDYDDYDDYDDPDDDWEEMW